MSAQPAKILYSSTTRTANARGGHTPTDDATFTPEELHEFVMTCKADGIPTTAFTARLYDQWRGYGLTHEVICEYIIPQTALCPAPSLRYAAAIARRLICEGKLTLSAAGSDAYRFDNML